MLDTSPDAAIVTLDFWADLSCPWCYVGSRRLALAVAHEPDGSVLTRWRAFQLHPGLPEDSADHSGRPDRQPLSQPAPTRLREAGREVGIVFAQAPTAATVDTSLAHRAVLLYDRQTRQRAVCAALYAAHFEHGVDIASMDAVATVTAQASGDTAEAVRQRLTAGEGDAELAADLLQARLLGVTAVPTYVAGRMVAVQGAQQVELLRALIAEGRRGDR